MVTDIERRRKAVLQYLEDCGAELLQANEEWTQVLVHAPQARKSHQYLIFEPKVQHELGTDWAGIDPDCNINSAASVEDLLPHLLAARYLAD